MTTVDIATARSALASDLSTILAIAELVVDELRDERGGNLLLFNDLRTVGDQSHYQEALAGGTTSLAVGMIDQVVVGYSVALVTQTPAATICMIEELVVHPSARGIGVGAELLGFVREWGVGHGCSTIESHVLPGNRAAKNFFERVGMVTRKMQVSADL